MTKINTLAYLNNGHWLPSSKSKLPLWLAHHSSLLNQQNGFSGFEVSIDVFEGDIDISEDYERLKNLIQSNPPDIFLNLPRKLLNTDIGQLLKNSGCISFSLDDFEKEELNNTTIFSCFSKIFDSNQAVAWLSEQLNVDNLVIFNQEFTNRKNLIQKPIISDLLNSNEHTPSISQHIISASESRTIHADLEFQMNTKKFTFELIGETQIDRERAEAFVKNLNLNVTGKTLFAYDLGKMEVLFLKALKRLYPDAVFFDATRRGGVVEGVDKIFHSYELASNLAITNDLRDLYGTFTDFEGYNLMELYRDIHDQMFCVKYLLDKNGRNIEEKKQLKTTIVSLLNSMYEGQDIYVGKWFNYCFSNNKLTTKQSVFYKRGMIQEKNRNVGLYFPIQPSMTIKNHGMKVWFLYIDVLKVKSVDISRGIWFCEFEVEINAPIKDPIEYINFLNNSAIDDLWDVKIIQHSEVENRYQAKYRVNASFDFQPNASKFPFDAQDLYIEYTLETSIKDGLLQPVPDEYVDRDFNILGWKIVDCLGGFSKRLVFDRYGTDLHTIPRVLTDIRCQWRVKRQSKISAAKSFVPLYILLFLSWYSSFLENEDATTAVGLNATVFLAGVALYFSAERPDDSSFTMIDKFFVFFYCAVALQIASEFSVFFGPEIYSLVHLIWQVSIPILVIVSAIWLYRVNRSL